TYQEMVYRLVTMIAKHNERKINSNQSPNEVYRELPKPNIHKLDILATSLMFWNKTSYTVRGGMIKITVNKLDYHYEIKDHDLKMILQNKKVVVMYDENDLDSILIFNENDNVICECQKVIKINLAKIDRNSVDEENIYKSVAKKKSYEKHISSKH